MAKVTSIMIVGVGGQGSLLASKLLGNVLMKEGHDVKVSEVHGMAQRGGSVVTYVKYGEKVYSPVVEEGEADLIISFELCEAARYLSYLKKGGRIIVNDQKIAPMPVITGAASYPEDIVGKIRQAGCSITAFDALSAALEAGSSKAVNLALLGALSVHMEFSEELWKEAIRETVPPKFVEMNLKAFDLGRQAG